MTLICEPHKAFEFSVYLSPLLLVGVHFILLGGVCRFDVIRKFENPK